MSVVVVSKILANSVFPAVRKDSVIYQNFGDVCVDEISNHNFSCFQFILYPLSEVPCFMRARVGSPDILYLMKIQVP